MRLWERVARVFGRRDAGAREEAERILLEADFGIAATADILDEVTRSPRPPRDGDFQAALQQAVARVLAAATPPRGAPGALARAPEPPSVILVFGVNGVGKTTTIAKLAHRLTRERRSVLLAAADTFRAGAGEQLKIWADRLAVPCVSGAGGADPAAVAFDAVAAARARGAQRPAPGRWLLVAGALVGCAVGTRVSFAAVVVPFAVGALMIPSAAGWRSRLLSLWAFAAGLPLTGLIVTKLDGTAKGGSVVAVQRAVPVPIRFIGTGEGLDDLEIFDAQSYARRLVSG